MNNESSRNFRYRYDLDGLRGIAIALVVFYHVFVGRVSGGVDVFLLLSGFFFLGSQLRYAAKPNASLNPWWPIWRTLRRLVPSLALVIAASYGLVQAFTPELMRTELAQQITATVFYSQNWELARQNADYAAASSSTSPLQHMWSMSVQGQFYLMGIAFALVLAAIMKLKPKNKPLRAAKWPTVNQIAGPILIVATVASFAYACRFGWYGTPENYYSTWSRAWELTLGAVLAIYGAKWAVPQRFADAVTGLGLVALLFTGALISDSTAYPGPLSLLPLGGAVLIIVGGGGRISRAMASKKARWLGDIAYSLYLWHWPLLILSTVYLGYDSPPWWLGVAIIAVSLLLADLTHRFVETPLRQHRKRPTASDMPVHKGLASLRERSGALRATGGVVVAAAVFGLLTILPLWNKTLADEDGKFLDPVDYPGVMALMGHRTPANVEIQPDPILVRNITPPTSVSHCFIARDLPGDYFADTDKDGNPCVFGDKDADFEVYLVGGSHAEQWASPLDKLGRKMGFKLVPYLRQDCPIELGDDVTVSADCAQWSKLVEEKLEDNHADLVISNTTRPKSGYGTGPDVAPAGYIAFWQQLAKHDIPFVGLRDNPWGFDDEGKPMEFDECLMATGDPVDCGMRRDEVYEPIDPAAAVLAQWPNMLAIDTAPWFCNSDGDCPAIIGNIMVYRDMHHISNAYADSTMPLLRDILRPILAGQRVQQEVPTGLTPPGQEGPSPDDLIEGTPPVDPDKALEDSPAESSKRQPTPLPSTQAPEPAI